MNRADLLLRHNRPVRCKIAVRAGCDETVVRRLLQGKKVRKIYADLIEAAIEAELVVQRNADRIERALAGAPCG